MSQRGASVVSMTRRKRLGVGIRRDAAQFPLVGEVGGDHDCSFRPTRVGACPLYRRGKRVFLGVSLINTGR